MPEIDLYTTADAEIVIEDGRVVVEIGGAAVDASRAAQSAAAAASSAEQASAALLAIPADVTFSETTITETRADGLVITTEFEAVGTILTTFGAPVSKAIRTTFNADGSISEVYA